MWSFTDIRGLCLLLCLLPGCSNPLGDITSIDASFDPSEELDLNGPTLSVTVANEDYATEQTWSWSCSVSCLTRYSLDESESATPEGDYSDATSASLSSGAGTFYLHIQAMNDDQVESEVMHVSGLLDASGPVFADESLDVSADDATISESVTHVWQVASDEHSSVSYYDVGIAEESGDSTCDATDFEGTLSLDWTRVPDDQDFAGAGWQIVDGATDGESNTISLSLSSGTYCSAVRATDGLGNQSYLYSDTWQPFVPTNVAGLVGWWDADSSSSLYSDSSCSTAISDGDTVGCWQDLSGQGNHATMSTPANRPSYSASVLNSRPGIVFDGAESLQIASANSGPFAAIGTGDFTIFYVVKVNAVGANHWVISNWDASVGYEFGSDASDKYAAEVGDDGTAGTSHTTTGQYRFFLTQRSGTNLIIGRDKDAVENFTRADTVDSPESTFFGRNGRNASEYLDGEVMEVVIFDNVISVANSISLVTYFAEKWGLDIVP